jgi:hypothetical protein
VDAAVKLLPPEGKVNFSPTPPDVVAQSYESAEPPNWKQKARAGGGRRAGGQEACSRLCKAPLPCRPLSC